MTRDDERGFLVVSAFGGEEKAAVEVQRAIETLVSSSSSSTSSSNDEDGTVATTEPSSTGDDAAAATSAPRHARLLPRGDVAHRGVAWLRLGPSIPPSSSPVSMFAALNGVATRRGSDDDVSPPPPPPPPPTPMRHAQLVFPISRRCDPAEDAIEACVRAEASAIMRGEDLFDTALTRDVARVAISVHTRGDDSVAAGENGPAPTPRGVVLDAALRGLNAARAEAKLPPVVAELHDPDVTVFVSQWRVPAATDGGGGGGEEGFRGPKRVNLLAPNVVACGISILPRELCERRAKNIVPFKPKRSVQAKTRPREETRNAGAGAGAGGDGGQNQNQNQNQNAEWRDGAKRQAPKAAKTSHGVAVDGKPTSAPAATAAIAPLARDAALTLLDAALTKRASTPHLVPYVRDPYPDPSLCARGVLAAMRMKSPPLAFRLIHGTGDGVDGITVDVLGRAILVEQHRRWAPAEPMTRAVAERFGADVPVFLKRRWSSDPAARGGVQVSGGALPTPDDDGGDDDESTHANRVVVKEPGTRGAAFEVWLTGEEHYGVFLDSRPARERVRAMSKFKKVLNLFSYTGGFGVAAAVGGALWTHNVDSKLPCLRAARKNYALNGVEVDPADPRVFRRADVIRFLTKRFAAKDVAREKKYDLVVVDPPPRFSRKSDWAFEAELHTGKLLAMCAGALTDTDATLIAGINALTVTDARFVEMIDEASALCGRKLTPVEWIGPGEDFPACPYRPTARFVVLNVEDARDDGGEKDGATDRRGSGTLADELGLRDEGGGDDDDDVLDEDDDGDDARGEAPAPANASDLACRLCGGVFASRNKLFRHLRSLACECGAWCESKGGLASAAEIIERGGDAVPRFTPPPPKPAAASKKKSKKVAAAARDPRAPRGATRPPAAPNELWIGGLPAAYATAKHLKQFIWSSLPGSSGIAQPVVRRVVRKGWRDKKNGGWVGYGFAQFRDETEALAAMAHIEGAVPAEGVRLKASRSTAAVEPSSSALDDTALFETTSDDADADAVSAAPPPLAPGEDPPLDRVLNAWPSSVIERRAKRAGMTPHALRAAAKDADAMMMKKKKKKKKKNAAAAAFAFEERRSRGASVPSSLRADLLRELVRARWPPVSHRPKVNSERYLVVAADVRGEPRDGEETAERARATNDVVDPFRDLKRAALAVLRWADPEYPCDHMAITRNFVGSPHVDREDASHQYAISLGDWRGKGGELVVESEDGDTRWVVDTRDKIGRVDGRFAHWVRGFDATEGTRYSVIYYVNKPKNATERTFAVDEAFAPAGKGRARTTRERIAKAIAWGAFGFVVGVACHVAPRWARAVKGEKKKKKKKKKKEEEKGGATPAMPREEAREEAREGVAVEAQ